MSKELLSRKLPIVNPTPYGFIERPLNAYQKEDSFLDVYKATVQRDFVPIKDATLEHVRFSERAYDPEFDFVKSIQANPFLLQNIKHVAHAKDAEHLAFLESSLRANQDRRDIAEREGLTLTSLAAEALNPINLLFLVPVFGQLGLAARGVKTLGQAGLLGAKQGALGAVAAETIRYPFDQLETPQEALFNIGASTALGGALGVGIPAAFRLYSRTFNGRGQQMAPEFERAEKTFERFQKGSIGDDIDGVSINTLEKADPKIPGVQVKDGTIILNEDRIEQDFLDFEYMNPSLSGGSGLGRNAFDDLNMYADFLIHKESLKIKTPDKYKPPELEELTKVSPEYLKEIQDGIAPEPFEGFLEKLEQKFIRETKKREDTLNQDAIALAADGYGAKPNVFARFNPFAGPALRIARDPDMPQEVKRYMSLLSGNNILALDRNTSGFGTNGVDQQIPKYTAMFRRYYTQLEALWVKDIKDRKVIKANWTGARMEEFLPSPKSMREWEEERFRQYIDEMSGTAISSDDPIQKEFNKTIRDMMRDFLTRSQDEGMLLGIENYDIKLRDLNQKLKQEEKMLDDLVNAKADPKKIKEVEARINSIKNGEDGILAIEDAKLNARPENNYNIPRFYDVIKLRNGKKDKNEYYTGFRQLLIDEFTDYPRTQVFNKKTNKMETVIPDPVKDADTVIENIINENNLPNGSPTRGNRAKHLKRRSLNIPDSKLKDYLILNTSVLQKYAENMGYRIAWNRNFGNQTLDDVLLRIEQAIAQAPNLSAAQKKRKIVAAKQAFVGDHLRILGAHVGDPHTWDNQVAKVATGFAAYTRLAASGITTIGDLANVIAARSTRQMIMDFATEGRKLLDNVADVEEFAEVLAPGPQFVRDQMFADARSGVQPSMADKILHYPDKLFFQTPLLGNDLLLGTAITRRIAAAYNASDIIKISLKIVKGTASKIELQQAGTLGLNKRVATAISKMPFEKSDTGKVYYGNTKNWPTDTKEGRLAHDAYLDAIELATNSQIILAKNFDRPLIVDGVVFVRYHPMMRYLGLTPDKRVSYQGKQYAQIKRGTGFLRMPFQFLNYAFGATSSVLGRSFDPDQERRLQHIAASLAISTLLLQITKPYIFDKDPMDIAARVVDRSGITGVYGDLLYEGIHTWAAVGGDPDLLPFTPKGKQEPINTGDTFLGPAPTLLRDLSFAARDYVDNRSSKNAQELNRQLPRLHIFGFDVDFKLLHDIFAYFD